MTEIKTHVVHPSCSDDYRQERQRRGLASVIQARPWMEVRGLKEWANDVSQ